MALFRIYKGPANKLKDQPRVNGYAYFTPEDGKFYIDTDTDRIPLNAYSADVLTSKPTIVFETADQDTDKAACIKITVGGQESSRYELPYASASHSGVLSLIAQEIYGVKTFKSSPVFSAGATLGSGQAIKDSSGKTIIGLAASTNPQTGGLYLYTSGASDLFHNGKSILTTANFDTHLKSTLDERYVHIDGDTMSGSLAIVTKSGTDAYVRINNSTHGVRLQATANARGLYDEGTNALILYHKTSNNTLYIAPDNTNNVMFGNGTSSHTKTYEFPEYTGVLFSGNVGFTGEAVFIQNGTLFYFGESGDHGVTTDDDGRAIMSVGDFLTENMVVSNSAQIEKLSVVGDLGVGGALSVVGKISTSASIEAIANITAGAKISAPNIEGTTTVKGGTLQATSTHATQALTVAGGGTFGETITAKTAAIGAGGATINGATSIAGTTTAQHINPSANNTYSLGSTTAKWNKVYATTFEGNATSATKFSSARTISLSGDVSGSASSTGESGWSITNMAIGTGKVTNAMLAGSIENGKLVNSSMTIAGTSVSLGGSISADTLRSNLGLTNAMHYIGVATVAITNQGNTDPKIEGYNWTADRKAGDVVIYSGKEYVWNGTNSRWELLGDEGSYKVLQTAVTSPTASGNSSAFIDTISQDTNGKITATKKNVQITVSASGSGDGVVNITPTSGTNGVTYNVTHTKKGPSSGTATYTSENSVTSITGAATSFLIPQISVDTYGHTTAGADETITITLPKSGSWFNNGFATVDASGISKLGRYLYFHGSSASTNTYDVRIDATTDAKQNTLYLPAETGQFVIHTNNTAIGTGTNPVYIAASGVATASTSTEGSSSLPVYLNAGTITACSGASIFSDFSSTPAANGETLSLTIAGQVRTLTLDAASATQGGVITTGSQTIAGTKTFSGDIKANTLTITNADGASHIKFSRASSYNYLHAPADSKLGICISDSLAAASCTLVIDSTSVFSGRATGTVNLGTSSAKWANVYATQFHGALKGNADTATQFSSSADIVLTGDVTGSASSQKGWSIATTLANTTVTAGNYGPASGTTLASAGTFDVPYVTFDSKGRATAASTKTFTLPTIGNATITISAGSGLTTGGSFTTNATSAKTITLNVGAGSGITVSADAVGHTNSVTAKTAYGSTSTSASSNGGTITLTDVKYDSEGHITGSTDRTITLTAHNLAKGTASTASASKSHGGTFTAITDFSVSGHTITPTVTTYTLPSETTLSKGTNATASASKSHGGTFTAITGLAVSGHTITPTVTTYTLPSETTLSKGTNATASSSVSHGGTFTAITGFSVSGHTITPTVTTYTLPSESQTLSGLGGVGTVTASGTSPLTLSASKSGTTVTISGSMTAASSTAAGYVTTGTQTIAGAKTFSSNLTCSGTITGTQVFNAVWNDYAEFRKAETIEPGRVVIEHVSGEMKISTERLQAGASIVSDTFGSAMGETDDCKTPLAVAGRALAYTYEDRDSYPLGAAVCTGPNGTVSLMTREEIMMYPERIVGTVSEIPNYETWGTGNVKVNGRIWIKVH